MHSAMDKANAEQDTGNNIVGERLVFLLLVIILGFILIRRIVKNWGQIWANSDTRVIARRGSLLPPKIIYEILLELPIETILICKSVCKHLNNVIQDPNFIQMQLHKVSHQPPRVLVQTESESLFSSRLVLLLLNISTRQAKPVLVQSDGFRLSRIESCCNGLLCLTSARRQDPVLVCNPISGDIIKLPNSNSYTRHISVGIGYNSSTDKYKVVRVFANVNENDCWFEIITLGESSWRPLDDAPCVLEIGTRQPLFFAGYLYWYIEREVLNMDCHYILAFDIETEKFHKIPVNGFGLRLDTFNWNLVNLNGCVALAGVDPQEKGGENGGEGQVGGVMRRRYHQVMRLWRVRGHESKYLHICSQHTCCLYKPQNGYRVTYEKLIAKIDDTYLLEYWTNDQTLQLGYYSFKKKEHMKLDFHEADSLYKSIDFQPTLVSPKLASM